MGCFEEVWILKVLVTGGAGFIGSHTVDKLLDNGAEVIIVDDLSTGKEANINPAADFVKLDIVSDQLSEVFQRFQPEYVVHLAAQVSVPISLTNPLKDCMTNVIGCVNLLENCRQTKVAKIVFSSSAAVYGNPEVVKVSEDTPTVPLSIYGVSKLSAEHYLQVFNHLYGLRYTVLRYANVFGPRQDASGEGGVVSIFAANVLTGRRPVIFGDGEQTRDFIYVGDIVNANLQALTGRDQTTLNIGTGIQTSVNRLFLLISEIAGTSLTPIYTEAREGDIRHSCMNNGKAVTALGWKPEVSLKEGLTKTLAFYGVK